ncbi:MAG: hypothetical protein Kow0092_12460 [Deferrisomatales bacterium]
MRSPLCLALVGLLSLSCLSDPAFAARCGTGLRADKPDRFTPLRPAPRDGAYRAVAPVPTQGAHVLATEHFRVLWGDAHDPSDPQWADPDGDGTPTWVEELADALETSYDTQMGLGFPEPYGSDRYYLDAYVANTGVRIYDERSGTWHAVTVGSSFYAYTEIDSEYEVAYFVFNDDFSLHTTDELGVLRATAAHELFHAVQRADYPWDDEVAVPDARWEQEGWWMEASATWMEEVCQPQVDDYAAYVQYFLATPEEALNSTDGLREYGAAIFAGYLWLYHGGEALWRETFRNAFAEGLERALDGALTGAGRPTLDQVVPAFWSLAAHPEDAWPDGEAFRAGGGPKLLLSSSELPLVVATSSADAPGRYGANLVRIDRFEGVLEGGIPQSDPGAEWRLAVSAEDTGAAEVFAPPVGEGTVPLWGDGSRPTYIAVVNISAGAGSDTSYRAYRALFTGPDGGADPAASAAESPSGEASSGGGGGCFLRTLSAP